MRYTVLFSIFLFAILTGCTKDKFGSTPSLKFKSVNSKIIPAGYDIQFTLTFTDAEGVILMIHFISKKWNRLALTATLLIIIIFLLFLVPKMKKEISWLISGILILPLNAKKMILLFFDSR